MPAGAILQTRRLVKSFAGVQALRGVDFSLMPGEVHAICGENGAGKSTMIKILCGAHPAGSFQGELLIDGTPRQLRGVADAQALGVAVIHQELALCPQLSVAENIFLGVEPCHLGLIDWERMVAHSRQALREFQLEIDPLSRLGMLGIGQQQLVEIARSLRRQSRMLILDEPTAALSEVETRLLLGHLRAVRQRGISVIYISHRLDEVFAIADRITVLRDGVSVLTVARADTDRDTIIRHMVGREIGEFYPRQASPAGEELLSVSGVDARLRDGDGDGDGVRLRGITFSVHAGEVVGIGGLMGAGRSELLLHLFGAWGVRTAGTVRLHGEAFDHPSPAQAIRRGLVMVTEDRKRLGLIMEQSIGFNLSLASLMRFCRLGLVQGEREFSASHQLFTRLGIKARDLEIPVESLSGGNQQKVVLGRALMTGPRVVFLDEPTRGIDVGAKGEIYAMINELTSSGHAVVLVSSELPELIGMSDRILMLGEGCLSGEFARGAASMDALLQAALQAGDQARRARQDEDSPQRRAR